MAKLGEIKKLINSTTETAFQRAIFWNGETIRGKKTKIKWLDIELPVIPGDKSRRSSIDLIGKSGNRYVICELKFGKNSKTECPDVAVKQLKGYYEQIKHNCDDLDKTDTHHKGCTSFKWKDLAFKKPILCVAANASYWAYWLGHRKTDISKLKGVEFYSVDIPADTFKLQKGNQDKYTPKIETNSWDIL